MTIAPAAPSTSSPPLPPPRRSGGVAAVLQAVLDRGPVARSTIGELSGLSPGAVSRHLSTLGELGLVRDRPAPRLRSAVGRPHVPVDIDTGGHVVAGLHVAVLHPPSSSWTSAARCSSRTACRTHEPFGALDALTRIRMHTLLLELFDRHRPAVLLVTHDVEEAVVLADRVLVLERGRIAVDRRIDLDRPRCTGDPELVSHRARLLEALGVDR